MHIRHSDGKYPERFDPDGSGLLDKQELSAGVVTLHESCDGAVCVCRCAKSLTAAVTEKRPCAATLFFATSLSN